MHEVRAARVIVACAALGTPSLLYRSGYGPRDYLETNSWSRTNSWGGCRATARAASFGRLLCRTRCAEGLGIWGNPWTSPKPRPWTELAIAINTGGSIAFPNGVALGPFDARVWLEAQGVHAKRVRNESHHEHRSDRKNASLELARRPDNQLEASRSTLADLTRSARRRRTGLCVV